MGSTNYTYQNLGPGGDLRATNPLLAKAESTAKDAGYSLAELQKMAGIKNINSQNDLNKLSQVAAANKKSASSSNSSTPMFGLQATQNDWSQSTAGSLDRLVQDFNQRNPNQPKLNSAQNWQEYANIKSVDSAGDLAQIERAMRNWEYQNEQQQKAAAATPAPAPAPTPAPAPAAPTETPKPFDPGDYAPPAPSTPEEQAKAEAEAQKKAEAVSPYLDRTVTEYSESPASKVYDTFLERVAARDAKVAAGEASPLDSIDRAEAPQQSERSWMDYAKEWGYDMENVAGARTSNRMAGSEGFGDLLKRITSFGRDDDTDDQSDSQKSRSMFGVRTFGNYS